MSASERSAKNVRKETGAPARVLAPVAPGLVVASARLRQAAAAAVVVERNLGPRGAAPTAAPQAEAREQTRIIVVSDEYV